MVNYAREYSPKVNLLFYTRAAAVAPPSV